MGKRVTIKDIANETGLSIAAVSYVLNGKEGVGQDTRDLVMKAVERLGYVPDYTARGLASSRSMLIGVCSPQTEPGSRLIFDNPFYSKLFSSIEYECRLHGYHVIISGTDADESFLKLARQRNLDGMIIVGSYTDRFYSDLKKSNVPVVLVDTYKSTQRFHEVRIDDRFGGYIATKYLIDKGHRNIAFISGALRECGGIELNETFVYPGVVSFESGAENAQKLIDNTPEVTAVFCTADIIAMGAIKKLQDAGIKVPDDISVMGFDNLNISEYASPSITTVGQDIELKGKAAVELVLNEISGGAKEPQCTILPLQIIERQSIKKL
jgi:LacI family transcriptional regulator